MDGPLWLASHSPRRRELLAAAGIQALVRPADIDDAALRPGRVAPADWAMALAYLKARRVAESIRDGMSGAGEYRAGSASGTVIGADTISVIGGRLMGQPRDAADARRMLRALRGAAHITMTGVALLRLDLTVRILFTDQATVAIGPLSDPQIDRYIDSGAWSGKAGGYNLTERLAAGWPIEVTGDPATVVGLPMRRLAALLRLAPSQGKATLRHDS